MKNSTAEAEARPASPTLTEMEFEIILGEPGESPPIMPSPGEGPLVPAPPIQPLPPKRHHNHKPKAKRCERRFSLHGYRDYSPMPPPVPKQELLQKCTRAPTVANPAHIEAPDQGAYDTHALGRQARKKPSAPIPPRSMAQMARFLPPSANEAFIAFVPDTNEAMMDMIKHECPSIRSTPTDQLAAYLIFGDPGAYTRSVLFRALPDTWPRALTADLPLILIKRVDPGLWEGPSVGADVPSGNEVGKGGLGVGVEADLDAGDREGDPPDGDWERMVLDETLLGDDHWAAWPSPKKVSDRDKEESVRVVNI